MSDKMKCADCGDTIAVGPRCDICANQRVAELEESLGTSHRQLSGMTSMRDAAIDLIDGEGGLRSRLADLMSEYEYIRGVLVMANKNCERRNAKIKLLVGQLDERDRLIEELKSILCCVEHIVPGETMATAKAWASMCRSTAEETE